MRIAILLLLLAAPCIAAAGEVFKCRMPDGSLAFLDHACPDAAKSMDAPRLSSEVPFAWRCGKDEPPPLTSKEQFGALTPTQTQGLASAALAFALAGADTRYFFDRAGNLHACASRGPDAAELVVAPDGRAWGRKDGKVQRIGGASKGTRLALCSDRIARCYDPKSRSLDQCVDAAPVCTTSEPVDGEPACCVQACISRYRELRAQNVDDHSALDRALFDNEACSGVKRGR